MYIFLQFARLLYSKSLFISVNDIYMIRAMVIEKSKNQICWIQSRKLYQLPFDLKIFFHKLPSGAHQYRRVCNNLFCFYKCFTYFRFIPLNTLHRNP